ncbi:hypothetical protein CNEO3_50096 [Clostridium neonatale]|nr:hypothetical protein CNEO3_50096 [Clostridium neonatale]
MKSTGTNPTRFPAAADLLLNDIATIFIRGNKQAAVSINITLHIHISAALLPKLLDFIIISPP